jgi:hypothetical protein
MKKLVETIEKNTSMNENSLDKPAKKKHNIEDSLKIST